MLKYKGLRLRTWILIKLLGIRVIFDNTIRARGRWLGGKTIYLRDDAGDMACLHEIGHVLNGYDCCREHDEWRAHGFSVATAKILRVPKTEIGDFERSMDVYSGMQYVCPRIDRRNRT